MKKTVLLSLVAFSLILSSCGTQKFYIGDTSGKEITQDKGKMVHLFWVIPIGRKKAYPLVEGAKGYTITTKYKLIDFLVTGLTATVIQMKSVKFEANK
jgi:hypothetical protein